MIPKLNAKIKLPTKGLWCFAFLLYTGGVFAQEKNTITLEQCYQLAAASYPLSKERGLIEKTKQYNIQIHFNS